MDPLVDTGIFSLYLRSPRTLLGFSFDDTLNNENAVAYVLLGIKTL